MSQHATGPWKNGKDANGEIIIFQHESVTGSNRNEQYQANRRLADAAPDYFEAAEHFPDLHDGCMSNHELMEACRDWFAQYLQPAHRKAKSGQ